MHVVIVPVAAIWSEMHVGASFPEEILSSMLHFVYSTSAGIELWLNMQQS